MTDEQFYLLDSVGVIIVRSAVPIEQVAYINERIDRTLAGAVVSKFPILEMDDVFLDMMTHSWILAACNRLLGNRFRFDHAFGLQQPPSRPNLHGGPQACQASCFYHASAPTSPPLVGRISVGIALTNQSSALGGFAYIPGSHKSSSLMHGSRVLTEILKNDFDHECLSIPSLAPGDICMFPDCLVHGTAPWRGPYTRRALYYMYSPGYMAWRPYQEIEKYLALAKTPLQRRLLRPPYVASFIEQATIVGDNQWREPNA